MRNTILQACLVLFGALLCTGRAHAQLGPWLPGTFDDTYAITSMNPLIMGDADAVVRLHDRHFVVKDAERATLHVRKAVTVLNAEGRDHGQLVIGYDRFRDIDKVEGRIRDASGEVVRKLGRDDQKDYSAISGNTLYQDHRVHVAELYHGTYPYTVEFEYEIDYKGLLNAWPDWMPQPSNEVPVEHTALTIETPVDLPFRYAVQNGSLEPERVRRNSTDYIRWTASMLPWMSDEPHSPRWGKRALTIFTAPSVFEISGTRGSMESWDAFGQWYYTLSNGRQQLPAEAIAEARQRVAGLTTKRAKVAALYRYMQESTRYVSIQLGIGGWQPFEASYVRERGYGDCKALTNYLQALLEAVGIRSYPALIYRGEMPINVPEDFPNNYFNHVVLALKDDNGETIWIECTSQTAPFGHVANDIEDRHALVVTPKGGRLVRTPRSTAADNQQIRTARVEVQADGYAVATMQTHYTGNQQDRVRLHLAQRTERERKDWLRNRMDVPNLQILKADFSQVDERRLGVTLPATMELPRYATPMGSRLFVRLNLTERWDYVPPEWPTRRQPIDFFPYAFADADTITYVLPEGYTLEAMPEPVTIEAPFARYEARVEQTPDGHLKYVRRLEVTESQLAPDQYEAFRSFLRDITEADRAQAVLVKS